MVRRRAWCVFGACLVRTTSLARDTGSCREVASASHTCWRVRYRARRTVGEHVGGRAKGAGMRWRAVTEQGGGSRAVSGLEAWLDDG